MELSRIGKTIRRIKRVFIGIIGFTILLIGIAMIALPRAGDFGYPLGFGYIGDRIYLGQETVEEFKR